ncbi:MAG: glutamate-5-semialdehyde dehydrogenase [Candidatus Omnitrophica bacterium CG1_02_46_14]|nr:MAG: glutamate-5-semialdehyde dehydrogenase [Candidatus Omnitrophica bacterium CG1_02_46_14]
MNLKPIKQIATKAKAASIPLSVLSTEKKNQALNAMAEALLQHEALIIRENLKDIRSANEKRTPPSLISRLTLDSAKIKKIADSLSAIAKLRDPVGRVISAHKRPNGLLIKKIGVPIGVILIIYESRPNVTVDCMALCLKSGNSVILKGGSEALHSNRAIFNVLEKSAVKAGVPRGAFQLVSKSGRETVKELLNLPALINLVIPRGGESLIREVVKVSKIPVIKHYRGVCHVFIDKDADFEKSKAIVLNAKVQNPGVCNAMETLLVHRSVAREFLPGICSKLEEAGVELRGDDATRSIIRGIKKAVEEDWHSEYLDLILSIRVVKNFEDALRHIQKYGTQHSDAIVTENPKTAGRFTQTVDSACVFVNCSTRFNDGGEFGMGAEMGISTDKLHARGPMGLEELTSYKYVVIGDGQTRS